MPTVEWCCVTAGESLYSMFCQQAALERCQRSHSQTQVSKAVLNCPVEPAQPKFGAGIVARMRHSSVDVGSRSSTQRLAVLLPVTSRRTCSRDCAGHGDVSTVLDGLKTLAASLELPEPAGNSPQLHGDAAADCMSCNRRPSSPLLVLLGVDHDDAVLLQQEEQLLDVFRSAGVPARFMQFDAAVKIRHGPGDVCKLWSIMANAALDEGCNLAVLVGEC